VRVLALCAVICFQTVALANGLDVEQVRACLENAANAASSENLEAYVQCFEPRMQASIRRTVGLRFAHFDVAVELDDFHILSADENTCEAAVRYRTHLSGRSFEIVAVLRLKAFEGSWRIQDEVLQSVLESTVPDSAFPYGCSSCQHPPRSSCSSGQCSLSGR
jgi:hypothetical protein